jgi:hypothetical protein
MDITIDSLRKRLQEKNLSEYLQFSQTEVEEALLIKYLDSCRPVIVGIVDHSEIRCPNSYQRRIVHIIAEAFDLDHVRYGAWNPEYERHFDWECGCKYCWEAAGKQYYRIRGVKIMKR